LYRQPRKIEQMMERLVVAIEKMDAKTDANQEKTDITLEKMEAG
jgi:hypothetical protein